MKSGPTTAAFKIFDSVHVDDFRMLTVSKIKRPTHGASVEF